MKSYSCNSSDRNRETRALEGEDGMAHTRGRVLMAASVASMIDQFNMPNIRLLQDMGYEVHVACNFRRGNTCDAARIRRLRQSLEGMGVRWHQWDCPRNLYDAGMCSKALVQLWKLAGRYRYDMVHCHSPVGGALARTVAHFQGIPVIYTAHGFHFYKGAPVKNWMLYYPAEKLLAYWTDVLVTVNREDYAFAVRNLAAGKYTGFPASGLTQQNLRAHGQSAGPVLVWRQTGEQERHRRMRRQGRMRMRRCAALSGSGTASRRTPCCCCQSVN